MERLIEKITEKELVHDGDHIIIALSGGPDSVYLFYLLLAIREIRDIELTAAHLNHGIRGVDADQDEAFCKDMAAKFKVPFYSKKVNVPQYARDNNLSLEDAARRLRYEFLRGLKKNNSSIWLAHHKGDQVETILLHFLRGTGLNGLIGMREKDKDLIRPLLATTKYEILHWLNENGIPYCIDDTNSDDSILRNKVRMQLVPYLEEEWNPNIESALTRMASILKDDLAFIDASTENLKNEIYIQNVIHRKSFLEAPIALQRRLLYSVLKDDFSKQDVSFELIERIRNLFYKNVSKKVNFSDLEFISEYEGVKVKYKGHDENTEEVNIPFIPEQTYYFDKFFIRSEIIDKKSYCPSLSKNRIAMDIEVLKNNLRLRTRWHGDRFSPEKFDGTKKLKAYFIDEKIPKKERDQQLLLAHEEDILWVIGKRRSSRFPITAESEKVLIVEKVNKEDEDDKA